MRTHGARKQRQLLKLEAKINGDKGEGGERDEQAVTIADIREIEQELREILGDCEVRARRKGAPWDFSLLLDGSRRD